MATGTMRRTGDTVVTNVVEGWEGAVEFTADLPITLGTPAIGAIYLVTKPTTILFGTYKTKQSGLYIRDFNNGNSADWRKLNVKVKFTDSEFAVVNSVDQSKQAKFDLSLITTATTRTYQWPDKDGKVALIEDLLENRITVTQENISTTLGGVIDSTKEYYIDGVIDCTGFPIEIPSGGITIAGYNFNLSKLICSDNNYTMFTSPIGGSGDIIGMDYAIEVTGTGSQVYNIKDATGFHAFEFSRVNYNDCTSLGVIDNYRQGLEVGTGRFGGKPQLELKGVWLGGYFIDTSIIRNMTDGAYSLFKAGAGFSMTSRFRSNMNLDLPTTASFFDFSAANFPNPSTIQITGAIITRNGVSNATDTNLTPNINETELPSSWTSNIGLNNTFTGGKINVTAEAATVIASGSTFYTLNSAAHTATELQHFDNPAEMQLRHLGVQPRSYKISGQFTIAGTAGNVISIRVVIWDDSESIFVNSPPLTRQINSLVGGRDVAFFSGSDNINLDQNDYMFFEVSNNSGNANISLEVDSYFIAEER